jgi:hypothetical protein
MRHGSLESHTQASGNRLATEGRSVPRKPARVLVLVMAGLVVVIVAFFSSYTSALGNPSAHHIPVAVIAPPAAVGPLSASPLLSVRPAPDLASARRMVEDRAVDGALALPPSGPVTLLVAAGGGHAVEAVLMQLGQQMAQAQGTTLNTVDVAPTSPADPNGTVEFYCVIFLGIGGAVGGTVLTRLMGRVRRLPDALKRLGVVLAYGGVLSLVVTFFADVVFGALVGHFGLLFLTMWAFSAAVCLAITGFAARMGLLATGVLIAVFILLGNPSAAGAVPRPLLNGFYSGLTPVLPQGAALSALRGVEYFGNHGIGPAMLCLVIWGAAGLLLLFGTGPGRYPPRHSTGTQS